MSDHELKNNLLINHVRPILSFDLYDVERQCIGFGWQN